MDKAKIYKIIATAMTAVLTCLAIAFGLQSCTATRVVSTTASYIQHGDTAVTKKISRTLAYMRFFL